MQLEQGTKNVAHCIIIISDWICWQWLYLSFDVSADLPVVSGPFSQKAEHRSQTLFVVGALLGVTQTTDTSQAGTVDRF